MATKPMDPSIHHCGGESWEVKRERLDASWEPLRDEKGRKVHGYAVIRETPAHMLGRELTEGSFHLTISAAPFGVEVVATRDDKAFGALPRSTRHATRSAALDHARKALAQQGRRYAKKYGAAS